MHEENSPSSWLREDVEGMEERERERERRTERKKAGEEESRSGNRRVDREEEKPVVVK